MAPHSSTPAWKIPWTEEPGRLQSMGSLRVRHDWATSLSLFTFMHWRRKWQLTPVFWPGESQGRGSLVGCHLWGYRVRHNWSNLVSARYTAPGEGNGNPLWYSCLENSMNTGAWWATAHRVAKSWTWLNGEHTHTKYTTVVHTWPKVEYVSKNIYIYIYIFHTFQGLSC